MNRQPPQRSQQDDVWPPAPKRSRCYNATVLPSKAARGIFTDYFWLDFLIGLLLGPAAFFVLFVAIGIGVEQVVPTLPVPKSVQWADWGAAVFGCALLVVLFVRRYPYLIVGFATTTLILAGSVLLFVIMLN